MVEGAQPLGVLEAGVELYLEGGDFHRVGDAYGATPALGHFWVDFFVRESKCFMVEQNLILFYLWCLPCIRKIWY